MTYDGGRVGRWVLVDGGAVHGTPRCSVAVRPFPDSRLRWSDSDLWHLVDLETVGEDGSCECAWCGAALFLFPRPALLDAGFAARYGVER